MGQLQIVLVFIASLVLHAKDMPEQEGAPGNLFRGPLFAFVMVLIGTMTLLMTFYMLVAEYCGIESPKDAQAAAGSVASSLRRFSRGRKLFSETKVPQATDDDDAAPEEIVVTPRREPEIRLSATPVTRTRAPTAAASTPAARPCPPARERRRLY